VISSLLKPVVWYTRRVVFRRMSVGTLILPKYGPVALLATPMGIAKRRSE
jgi:hypothetical protein